MKFHPKEQPQHKILNRTHALKMNSLRINPFDDYGETPDFGESQNLERQVSQIPASVDLKRKSSNFDLRINVNRRHQRLHNQNIDEMVDDLS